MRVLCDLEYVQLENEKGALVDGVCVTCGRCDHSTESFGRGENSILRCLAKLRDQCPEGEENSYDIGERAGAV